MKTFLVLLAVLFVVLVGLAYTQGWLSFSQDSEKATIDIHKREIQEDTEEAAKRGKEMLRDAGSALERAGEEVHDSVEDKTAEEDVEEPDEEPVTTGSSP